MSNSMQTEPNENGEIQGRILFVDDEENILISLKRLMRKRPLECFFASSGEQGLSILEKEKIDIIVSDMRMPNMDGAEFLTRCKTRWPRTVRILLTGHSDINSTISALNHGGIFRYLNKPWDDEDLISCIDQGLKICKLEKDKLALLLLTKQQNENLFKVNTTLERRVEARTEEVKQTSDMLELVYQQLADSYTSFIKLLSSVISSRKNLEKTQSSHVAELAKQLAISLKLPSDEVSNIYHSGLLIDLGKLALSDEILECCDEKITSNNRKMFEQYPLVGEMTLSAIAELAPAAHLVRSHMEYIDGTGFPDKLKGSAIPRGSRILRVARDFIGLQTGRVKEVKLNAEESFKVIKLYAGKRYDPIVVKMLEPISENFSLEDELAHEIRIDPLQLSEGMIVSRDIYNSGGILMIAKGFILNRSIIEKLMSIHEMSSASLNIFVYKEEVE